MNTTQLVGRRAGTTVSNGGIERLGAGDNGVPASTPALDSLVADYERSRVTYKEAQAAMDAAGAAMMAAQCRAHFATTPSERPGYNTRHHCTLEKGHAGDHANPSHSGTPVTDGRNKA